MACWGQAAGLRDDEESAELQDDREEDAQDHAIQVGSCRDTADGQLRN